MAKHRIGRFIGCTVIVPAAAMDIAYFVTAFPSLSQTFVLNQITGLIDRGHDMTIYSRRPGDAAVHPDIEQYNLLQHTRYCPMLRPNPFLRLGAAAGLLSKHYIRHPGTALRTLNIARFGYRAASLELLFAAVPMLGNTQHDIVHAHFAPNGITCAMLKDAGILRSKIVTTFHDYGLTWYLRTWGPHVYDHLFEHGDLFLAISRYARNRLIELGYDESKVIVHHMGVDCNRFAPAHRSQRHGGPVQLLSVCRLTEKKGIEYALRAIAKLRDTASAVQYTIIGDGPLRSSLESFTRELNCEHVIQFAGSKTQDEVAAALHSCDILLAPSVTAADGDAEGIPVVLMEAMAAGVAVISTTHAAIPELIQDNSSGLLAPERDVDALVQRIELLVHDETLRHKLAAAGRAVIERDFNIDTLNDQLEARFERLESTSQHVNTSTNQH